MNNIKYQKSNIPATKIGGSAENFGGKNTNQNSKFFKIFFLLFFTLYTLHSTLYTAAYAQHEGHKMQTQTKEVYQCPMHPQVISDKPGKCPICGMNLALVTQQEEKMSQESMQGSVVKITPAQQKLIGLETEPVLKRPLKQTIRATAKIAYDPELYKAQEEFIQIYKTKLLINPIQSPEIARRLEALSLAAGFKLRLMGVGEMQIEEMKTKTESDRSLLISDYKTPYAWAYLTIYEYDLSFVKVGDHTIIKTIAYPGEEFEGRIVSIDPVLDMNTRSVRARVQVYNAEGKLKPNMYADGFIHIDLGERLALSREAVLDTGLRKIVYVDLGDGRFKAQEVETGPEAIALVDGAREQKFYPVIKGLNENDLVVTKGSFLIDSQSQLTGGMSALWGGAMEIKTEGESEIKTQHKH